MNREQLMSLSILELKGLDIKSQEDEKLVQEILNAKLEAEPRQDPNRMVLSSSATDNLSPEKEKALQEKIDGVKVENHTPNIPEKTENTDTIPKTPTAPKHFCNFCDSKGVRHKKNCTRSIVQKNE